MFPRRNLRISNRIPSRRLPRERDSKEIRSAGFMARGRLAVPF